MGLSQGTGRRLKPDPIKSHSKKTIDLKSRVEPIRFLSFNFETLKTLHKTESDLDSCPNVAL